MSHFGLAIHRRTPRDTPRGTRPLAVVGALLAALAVAALLLLGYAMLGVLLVVALVAFAVGIVWFAGRALWQGLTGR